MTFMVTLIFGCIYITLGDSEVVIVPYLCQLVFAAISYIVETLIEMFFTVIALKYALLVSQ